jgi:hypothetical protein
VDNSKRVSSLLFPEEEAVSKNQHSENHPSRRTSSLETWRTRLDIIQKGFACVAILCAAGWFYFRAEAKGKAVCTHQLSLVMVNNGKTNLWWGNLEVGIENVGHRTLNLSDGLIKISQLRPLPDGFELKLNPTNAAYRVDWPQLVYRGAPLAIPILPGETDFKNFEFFMPTNVQAFRVYSYVSLGTNQLGWSRVSIYEIKDGKAVRVKEPEDLLVSFSSQSNTDFMPAKVESTRK